MVFRDTPNLPVTADVNNNNRGVLTSITSRKVASSYTYDGISLISWIDQCSEIWPCNSVLNRDLRNSRIGSSPAQNMDCAPFVRSGPTEGRTIGVSSCCKTHHVIKNSRR